LTDPRRRRWPWLLVIALLFLWHIKEKRKSRKGGDNREDV